MLLAEIGATRAPGLRVALLRPDGRRLVDRLEAGEADLAVSADDALPGGDGLHRRLILRDRYATAQRHGHPRGTAPISIDAFCAADHIIVSDDAAFADHIDAVLHALGKQRRVVLSVHSYLLAPLIVGQSDLLVTLPHRLLAQHAAALHIGETPLPLAEVALKAFWHDRTHDDPANRWARNSLFGSGLDRTA